MSEVAQDVVVCGGCGKSYRTKPELAGKKAKCKCGETVRFPAAPVAVSAAGLEPLDGGDGAYDVIEAPKAPPTPAPIQKMTACKGCTAAMPANAVLCTRCGMNQKTGKKMGTQVQKEGKDASDIVVAAGKTVLSLFLGGLTAVIMAALWLTLIYFTHMKMGYFSLAIGGAVGFIVRLINPYGNTTSGLIAGGMTLLGIAIAKGIMVLVILNAHGIILDAVSIYDIFCIPSGILLAARMGAGLTR